MTERSRHTGQLVLAALMTALTAVCAQIQIPLPPVPASLATLCVCLCGALLSPRYAAYAMASYALLGLCGVPVFAGFAAGPSVLLGPTGGYIAGYVLSAPAIALLLRRTGFAPRGLVLSMALGAALYFLTGTLWFLFVTGSSLSAAFAACVLPFLPSEAAKIAAAAMLALRLKAAIPSI